MVLPAHCMMVMTHERTFQILYFQSNVGPKRLQQVDTTSFLPHHFHGDEITVDGLDMNGLLRLATQTYASISVSMASMVPSSVLDYSHEDTDTYITPSLVLLSMSKLFPHYIWTLFRLTVYDFRPVLDPIACDGSCRVFCLYMLIECNSLLKLKEPAVLLRCRKDDVYLVESVLDSAKEEYAEKANVHIPEVIVDYHVYLPPAPSHHNAHSQSCSGGVVLASRDGKIVCENTLDARLDVVFHKKLPEIRRCLFSQAMA
ncbi:hypothetical protein SAY86_019602 [Trapa natans]|uniref:Uncharacterized protein n=1 Tax=Trapa natans TaxID=22666 RepID=A0AAN7R6Z1_TRANT|nr:hypothetical protein SAY86_019602 [Trapa natans]